MSQGLIGTYKSSMYAFRDSAGYAVGQNPTPDTKVNGTVYGAYLYDKHISIGTAAHTIGKRFGLAGGKVWVQRVTGVTDIADVPFEFSGLDTVLDGFFKGYTPDVTTLNTAIIIAPHNVPTVIPKMISVHHMEFDNADGSSQWLSLFFLNAQHKDTGGIAAGQGEGANPNPLAYAATPDYSSRAPWGQLFSDNANLDLQDDRQIALAIISNWRYAIATYIDNGVATTYKLPYLPASSVVTNHFVYKNGVATPPSNINTSTGIVTITAGTAGQIWQHLFPVGNQFTPSP